MTRVPVTDGSTQTATFDTPLLRHQAVRGKLAHHD